MNITSEETLHSCTSCGGCASVCPTNAIAITLDEQGFYRPTLDVRKCVDCSLCTEVCYKYDEIKMYDLTEHKEVQLLACQSKDAVVLNTTTSGGVAYLLARTLYKQGYKCVGVIYDIQNDSAKHICATTEQDIELFKGSKYIQSMTYPAFKQMLDKREKGQKFALFGTPCQIYTVDKFLRRTNRRSDFLLVDIYCHGCPSLKIWQKYIQEIKMNLGKTKFDGVDFRSKMKGWGNFCVVIVLDGLRVFVSNKKKDEFYQLFFSNLMLNEACQDCALRSSLEYTDIRLGDFWGRCYDTETKGVSGVTLVSERGKQMFKLIQSQVLAKEHVFSDFLPYQSWGVKYKINETVRKHLFNMLRDKSLKEMQDYYFVRQSLLQKIKRNLKNVVLLLPQSVIGGVKKIYHQI